MKSDKKLIKYIRIGLAVLLLALGAVFMLIPVIPLGYILLFAGLFLLVPYIPFLNKWLSFLKKKDHKNRINKAEEKINKVEDKIITTQKSE